MVIKMKFYVLFVVWWIHCIDEIYSQILIPEELPSILSVFYSNVPPIKKGTDSRVGVGFRLGQNADFQVQVEIGPQLNTQPIGPNASRNTLTNTRPNYIVDTANDTQKRETNELITPCTPAPVPLNSTNLGEIWLNVWKMNVTGERNSIVASYSPESIFARASTTISPVVVDPTKNKDNVFVNQLRKLYSTPRSTTTTDAIDGDNFIESINNTIRRRID